MNRRKASRDRRNPTEALSVRLISSRSSCSTISESDSETFRMTLPVNPSVTITSTRPLKTSRPSTLPMKFKPVSFSVLNASLERSLPLVSSSPIDIRPIEGEGFPKTSCA